MWFINIYLFVLLLFIILIRNLLRGPSNYPPGPLTLPVVGHLPSLLWNLRKLKYHHLVWQLWYKNYGPVVGLKFCSSNVVVVSGRDAIKEVSSREEFSGRPDGFFYTVRTFGKNVGLIFTDGPIWHKTRRSVLRAIKAFGFGSSKMAESVLRECEALVQLRIADAGKPVAVNYMFDVAVFNVLFQLLASKRYDLNDERPKRVCSLMKRAFRVVDFSGGLLNFMPFLRHIAPGLIGYTELKEIYHALHAFMKEVIAEHQETLDVNHPRDIIDSLLIEMAQNEEDSYTQEELLSICMDLLEAGVETTGNSCEFLLLYLVRDQELQQRIVEEIDREIGHSRPPSLSDRSRMVYTESVILELLRVTSVASVGIPHRAMRDARLGDYVIPKGTCILLNLFELHHGDHWEQHSSLRPERFLSNDGKLLQDEYLLPFGYGKRRCIGEGLARSELFLILTSILQKFYIRLPEGDPLPSTEPVNGVTLSPKDFRVIFEPRKVI